MKFFTTDGEKNEKGGFTWIYTMTTKLFSSYYNNIKNQYIYIYMNNMPIFFFFIKVHKLFLKTQQQN